MQLNYRTEPFLSSDQVKNLFRKVFYLPIRWRLTAWFVELLAAVLLLFGLIFYFTLQTNFLARIDESLNRRADEVQSRLDLITKNIPNAQEIALILENDPVNEFAEPGLYAQILDRTGRVQGDSASLGKARLPIDPALIESALNGQFSLSEAQVSSERVRIRYTALTAGGQVVGVLQVGESLKPFNETLGRVRGLLFLVGGVALLVAAVGGWFLTRRALRPVVRVTETARRIARTRDFDERIPLSNSFKGRFDEIGDLAATFNHMIEELGRVFDTNRQFMADTSHELRTPLTIIQGNLDVLSRGLPPAESQEALDETREEATRLSRLVGDLLLLAQADAGLTVERLPVDLAAITRQSFRRAEGLAVTSGKTLHLKIERLDEAPILGDEYRLGQVVFNLLENAIRYTPDGGSVTLSLEVLRGPPVARLSVRDTGVGISLEHLPHLFERFYRVDKARSRALGGSGLGLAIVKYIVDAHGGQVAVQSEPGQGSVFTLTLPLRASNLPPS